MYVVFRSHHVPQNVIGVTNDSCSLFIRKAYTVLQIVCGISRRQIISNQKLMESSFYNQKRFFLPHSPFIYCPVRYLLKIKEIIEDYNAECPYFIIL